MAASVTKARVRLAFTASAMLLASCDQRHPLLDVPVAGGTAEQRADIAEELERFERWVGPGRVELPRIEVVDDPDHAGSYNRLNGAITLSAGLDGPALQSSLRHELCHGLDAQGGLLDDAEPAFDELASAIEDDESHPLHGWLGSSRRSHRAEVFAYVCEEAPLGTALLGAPCSGESTGYADVAAWITDTAWTGEPDVVLDGSWSQDPPLGPWVAPFVVDRLRAYGSESLDAARFYVLGEWPESEVGYVSTEDGAEVDGFDDDIAFDQVTAGYEVDAPPPAGTGTFDLSSANPIKAVSTGAATVRIVSGLALTQIDVVLAPRVLALDSGDETWSVVDGACPGEGSSVFVANGRFYTAWPEGSGVVWAEVTASESPGS